jgi:hypothetical protein
MAGAGQREVGDFAADPEEREAVLEQVANAAIERGYAEDLAPGEPAFPHGCWLSEHVGILTYPQVRPTAGPARGARCAPSGEVCNLLIHNVKTLRLQFHQRAKSLCAQST